MADTETSVYVGSNKVSSVAVVDNYKTPMGSNLVDVTYESGAIERFTKKTYELVVTDVASDASIVRRTKFNAMVPSIITVICEFDLKVSEMQSLLQEVANSLDNSFGRATNYVWTNDDRQYVPNSNPLFDRGVLDADRILKSIPTSVEAEKPTTPAEDAGQQS